MIINTAIFTCLMIWGASITIAVASTIHNTTKQNLKLERLEGQIIILLNLLSDIKRQDAPNQKIPKYAAGSDIDTIRTGTPIM